MQFLISSFASKSLTRMVVIVDSEFMATESTSPVHSDKRGLDWLLIESERWIGRDLWCVNYLKKERKRRVRPRRGVLFIP